MPTKIYWYLPQQIIVNEHIGELSIASLIKAVEVTLELAADTEQNFHLLIDARRLDHTPSNIGELSNIAKGLLSNPRLDKIFLITSNQIHKFIGNLVIQLVRKPVKIVMSLEEALELLQKLDSKLPDLAKIQPDTSNAIEVS